MSNVERISVEGGKYTVVIDGGKMQALRYGEHWQDLTGNKFVYCLATELKSTRFALADLYDAFIKRNGCFPLPHTQGFEAMEAARPLLGGTLPASLRDAATSTPTASVTCSPSYERFDPVKQQNEGGPAVGAAVSKSGEPFTYDARGERTGWEFAIDSQFGTIRAVEPDGTRHAVQRGDMNTLAGHGLLNAMVRDLTTPAAVYVKGLGDFKPEDLRNASLGPLVPGAGPAPYPPLSPGKIEVLSCAPGSLVPGAGPAPYPPLSRDEIAALSRQVARGMPTVDWLVRVFAIYERLRAQGKRPVDPADMTEAEQAAHWGASC